MKNHYCSSEICKTPLEERMTEITIRLFDQIGESLLSQHYLIEVQSKKNEELNELALKILELCKEITKYRAKYEFMELQIFPDREA
jgi:hypothetical protein